MEQQAAQPAWAVPVCYAVGTFVAVAFATYAFAYGTWWTRKMAGKQSTEDFITARGTQNIWRIGWSFYAGAVGAWVIVAPSQVTACVPRHGQLLHHQGQQQQQQKQEPLGSGDGRGSRAACSSSIQQTTLWLCLYVLESQQYPTRCMAAVQCVRPGALPQAPTCCCTASSLAGCSGSCSISTMQHVANVS